MPPPKAPVPLDGSKAALGLPVLHMTPILQAPSRFGARLPRARRADALHVFPHVSPRQITNVFRAKAPHVPVAVSQLAAHMVERRGKAASAATAEAATRATDALNSAPLNSAPLNSARSDLSAGEHIANANGIVHVPSPQAASAMLGGSTGDLPRIAELSRPARGRRWAHAPPPPPPPQLPPLPAAAGGRQRAMAPARLLESSATPTTVDRDRYVRACVALRALLLRSSSSISAFRSEGVRACRLARAAGSSSRACPTGAARSHALCLVLCKQIVSQGGAAKLGASAAAAAARGQELGSSTPHRPAREEEGHVCRSA